MSNLNIVSVLDDGHACSQAAFFSIEFTVCCEFENRHRGYS